MRTMLYRLRLVASLALCFFGTVMLSGCGKPPIQSGSMTTQDTMKSDGMMKDGMMKDGMMKDGMMKDGMMKDGMAPGAADMKSDKKM